MQVAPNKARCENVWQPMRMRNPFASFAANIYEAAHSQTAEYVEISHHSVFLRVKSTNKTCS